jgi:hypothetical protein
MAERSAAMNLPEMPARIAGLRRDSRGYPVPWFVAWMDGPKVCVPGAGKPDFRVIAPGKFEQAHNSGRCWICGDLLGRHKVYVLGPMCVVSRTTNEPASHRECAEFAATACPFLTNPRQKRSGKNLPDNRFVADGAIDRNPGAVALYQTRLVEPFQAGRGVLFRLGPPERIDWYAEGRAATAREVEDSISSGYPLLVREAEKCGQEALAALPQQLADAMMLLPAT